MTKYNCEQCVMRKKYDTNPKSLIGRLWRFHTNFCPGWKVYFKSLSDTEKSVLKKEYNLK